MTWLAHSTAIGRLVPTGTHLFHHSGVSKADLGPKKTLRVLESKDWLVLPVPLKPTLSRTAMLADALMLEDGIMQEQRMYGRP